MADTAGSATLRPCWSCSVARSGPRPGTRSRRCGECGLWRELVAGNEEVARYDAALDRREDAIRRALAEIDDAAGFTR
jgi:hypothetical protein